MPHRIELRGPWEYERLVNLPPLPSEEGTKEDAAASNRPAPRNRLTMPISWRPAFGPHAGSVRFSRRFQWPAVLDENERVILVFDGIGGTGRVQLNDEPLGMFDLLHSSLEYDITARLRSTNLLEIDLAFDPAESPQSPGGLWGPVALEVRETSGR
jgi:beta-galactosidase/beta-glucuronidase